MSLRIAKQLQKLFYAYNLMNIMNTKNSIVDESWDFWYLFSEFSTLLRAPFNFLPLVPFGPDTMAEWSKVLELN